MAGISTPIFPQTVRATVAQILPADTSTLKTLYTAATNGSKIESIRISSTDGTARDIQLYVTVSGTDYLLGTVSVPANSGNTNALATVDMLNSSNMNMMNTDINGNRYLYLETGFVLKAKTTSTVSASKAVQFFINGGDY